MQISQPTANKSVGQSGKHIDIVIDKKKTC